MRKYIKYILLFGLLSVSHWGMGQDSVGELLRELAQTTDPDQKVSLMIQAARVYKNQNNYDQALTYYFKAKHLLEKDNSDINTLAQINDELGLLYEEWGGYDKSVEYFLEARNLKRRLNDLDGQALSLEYAAWAYFKIGNYNDAAFLYEEMLAIRQKQGKQKAIGEIYNRLSIVNELDGRLDKALEYGQKDFEISLRLNDREGMATALNNMGYLYRKMKKNRESLRSFQQAIEINEEMLKENPSLNKRATLLSNIGVIYTNLRAYNDALEYYEQALALRQKEGKSQEIANAYNHIAANYFLSQDYERALRNVQKAVEQAKRADAKDVLLDSYRILSDIYEAEGNLQEYGNYNRLQAELRAEIEAERNQKEKELLNTRNFIQQLEDKLRLSISQQELEKEKAERAEQEKQLAQERAEKAEKERALAENQRKLAITRAQKLEQDRQLARARAEKAEKERALARARAQQLENERKIARLNEEKAKDEAEKARQAKELAEYRALQAEEAQERLREQQKRRNQLYIFSTIIAFLMLITGFILFFLYKNRQKNRMLRTQNKKIQEQNHSLEQQKVEIEEQRDDLIELNEEIKQQKEEIESQRDAISIERKKSDDLLLNILPLETAKELKETGHATPRFYEMVSVLFTDFKGFTFIAAELSAEEVVKELDFCFNGFDEIIEKHRLEKIKTIGDAYMCAGGVPLANKTNPIDAVKAGLEIQNFMQELNQEKRSKGQSIWELRLGIHTGSLVTGVIGKKKFAYDIWGDAVNVASRLESSGEVGKVNISGATYELVKDHFQCQYRGKLPAKNKGEIDMYFVEDYKRFI